MLLLLWVVLAARLLGGGRPLAAGVTVVAHQSAASSAREAAIPYARIPAVALITPLPWCVLQLTRPFPVAAQLLMVICIMGAIAVLWRSKSAGNLAESVTVSRAGTAGA